MTRKGLLRATAAAIVLGLLAACGGGGGGGDAPPAAAAGTRTHSTIYSVETGISQMFERDRSLPVSLVRAGTTQGNSARVAELGAHVSSRGYTNLRLRTLAYTNGHLEMDAPSFSEGLAFILEGP